MTKFAQDVLIVGHDTSCLHFQPIRSSRSPSLQLQPIKLQLVPLGVYPRCKVLEHAQYSLPVQGKFNLLITSFGHLLLWAQNLNHNGDINLHMYKYKIYKINVCIHVQGGMVD